MKKLIIGFSVAIVLVFSTATMASADWFSTWDIVEPTPIGAVSPWTFDIYAPNPFATEEVLAMWWTDDIGTPYKYFDITPLDRSGDTFAYNFVDLGTGLDVTLAVSGLSNLNLLTPGAVGGSLTSNGPNERLLFSASQMNFDNAPIHEPATLFLVGIGLVGIAGIRRKKLFSEK